ncbi:MAG: hypothetical protein Q9195_000205 [Heterodermia aff. obscurata]
MTVALSTTKRKFHKILDSISNASNTSLVPQSDTDNNVSTTTLPATLESPAKRPRTARPVSAFVTSTPLIARAQVRASSSVNRSSAVSAMPTIVPDPEPPNFAPWDRGQFLKRLESFRHVDKWMGKPEKIDEVHWAKRGWSCVGRDTVRCVGGCSQELVIELENDLDSPVRGDGTDGQDENDEDDWREKAREQLVEKYVEKVVTGHSAECLWRRRGCDDMIFRLPLYHQTTAISSLRQRYESLLAMAADLPTNLSTPPSFDLSEYQPEITTILQPPKPPTTPSTAPVPSPNPPSPTRSPPAPPLNREALLLALFGWQAETGHIPGLASCSTCFRRLGLWLFIPQISATTGEEKEATMARLDLVGEHRDYCPWIDAVSQNGPAGKEKEKEKAGWAVLAKLVLGMVRTKRREQRDEKPRVPLERRWEDEVSVSRTFATGTTAVESGSRSEENEKEKEKDKERWARLKRIKQAFTIKKGRKKEGAKAHA